MEKILFEYKAKGYLVAETWEKAWEEAQAMVNDNDLIVIEVFPTVLNWEKYLAHKAQGL